MNKHGLEVGDFVTFNKQNRYARCLWEVVKLCPNGMVWVESDAGGARRRADPDLLMKLNRCVA